jgi:pimeloyl-ACP methyl ester carboxylesterase
MHHLSTIAGLALAVLATTRPIDAGSQSSTGTPSSAPPRHAGYATVNGLRMYYEIHGPAAGMPLVLVHGGGSTIGTTFGRILPLLARSRRVIAVEVQAHGHTRDIDRPFTFEQDADDIAALLDSLHVEKADLFGFSNGGTTALQTAIRHPAKVHRLVVASANFRRDGMQPGFWDAMQKGTFADMPKVYADAYLKINPSQEGVHAMYERDRKRMLAFKDIAEQDIRSIEAPTLVVDGDRDVIRPEHAVELSKLLPHGRLCILPGGHGEYFGEIMFPRVDARAPGLFVDLVNGFLSSAARPD